MTTKRGDVVLVWFPHSDLATFKCDGVVKHRDVGRAGGFDHLPTHPTNVPYRPPIHK